MADQGKRAGPERWGVAVALAAAAGFVDGVGYLVLAHMFTAHMSGNTIAGGVHLGDEDWPQAAHRLFPVPVFVAGVACGRVLVAALARRRVRSLFAPAFGCEALLLVLFLLGGLANFHDGSVRPGSPAAFYLLAALPALAMGLQNATLRTAGGGTVRTTYITGGLTDLTEEAVDYLAWRWDRARPAGPGPEAGRLPSLARAGVLLAVWLAYVLGAAAGAVAERLCGLPCLLAPIGLLALLAVADVLAPLAGGSKAASTETSGPAGG